MNSPIHLTARRARDAARRAIRFIQLRRGLSSLSRTFHTGRKPEPGVMRQLVRGWGNEAWSANTAFLSAILEWLPQTSGPILECGSGLSTMLLATASEVTGRRVFSLENDQTWAAIIERRIPARLMRHLTLSVAPLRSYGDFHWYSLDRTGLPESAGFVVCDGPPGATPGGRYGLAPVLGGRLSPGAVILLDDTQRPEERAIVSRWCHELDASMVQDGGTFVALRVGVPVQAR